LVVPYLVDEIDSILGTSAESEDARVEDWRVRHRWARDFVRQDLLGGDGKAPHTHARTPTSLGIELPWEQWNAEEWPRDEQQRRLQDLVWQLQSNAERLRTAASEGEALIRDVLGSERYEAWLTEVTEPRTSEARLRKKARAIVGRHYDAVDGHVP
jgi:hypothetical protein